MTDLTDHMEQAWIIICSRCKVYTCSYALTSRSAGVNLRAKGWALDPKRPRVLCPECISDLGGNK